MRSFLTGLILVVSVFLGLSFGATREASALRCAAWNGGTCVQYRPDYPLNGRTCSVWPYDYLTPPAAGEVNIYSAPSRGGWCVTLPARMGLWNFDGTNGWYGPWYVKDIWVGSGMNAGFVCYQQWGRTCADLLAGYDYSYPPPAFPYYYSPGWQSIQVWNY